MASTLRTSNAQLLARRKVLNGSIRYSSTKTAPCTTYVKPTHTVPADAKLPSTATLNIIDTYARPPFIFSHGKGSWVWTTNGQKYLDFSSGIAVNALGHADEGFADAMNEQVRKISHTSNVFHNEWAGQLATLIVETTQKEGGLGWTPNSSSSSSTSPAKVFFSNSGTEANEGAFKFARKIAKERYIAKNPGSTYADCPQVNFVCFENAFHGRSMGALSATSNPKYQKPFEPLVPGFSVGELNDYEGVKRLIDEKTCAVVLEPVQGEGGLAVCEEEWLRLVRKRCDEVGAVLIFDEIQCGLYRTGTLWAHSSLPVDCHPDIVTMAKPLANGYPIGAILIRGELNQYITTGSHGTTFGGSPLATRLGHHVLTRLSSPSFLSQMRDASSHLASRLQSLPALFPTLLHPSVRGKGLLTGLGFQDPAHPGKLVAMARERGLLVLTAGKDAVRIVPSLIVNKEEVDHAVDVIESCLVVLKEEEAGK